MTVGAILTLGLGSFGGVNLLPTLGYGVGEEGERVGAASYPILHGADNRFFAMVGADPRFTTIGGSDPQFPRVNG